MKMAPTIPEVIRKKRDGFELEPEEIEYFVNSVVRKEVDDCQIGAMLMAMYLKKQTLREIVGLTRAMTCSGETLKFDGYERRLLVDKHSTGGVGDKVSIVLAPALAACGYKVPMISGRSLGYTGGTLDKLESIPGFQTQLNFDEMKACLANSGCFIGGATSTLAPADGILYKFRDITSTVEDAGLIAASILSKKASEGIGTLVMDVKFGKGTSISSETDAVEMGELLRRVGKDLGLNVEVVISEMDTPLGKFVGNALEVVESVMCLRNEIRNEVSELVKLLGGVILKSTGSARTVEEGKERIERVLENSEALQCFFRMMVSQGVSEEVAEKLCAGRYWEVLKKSRYVSRIGSPLKGAVAGIDASNIAKACWELGGGRVKAESGIDHSVGVVLLKGIGNPVEKEEAWIEVHHSSEKLRPEIEKVIRESLTLNTECAKYSAKFKARII